jgi:transposase InsO family protein
LLGVIDDHSRLGCHLQWYRAEDTQALVHGFCQALAKRGLPRSCMTDNGSAMISEEFVSGLHNLGIVHERTLSYAAYQNGKQENLWATLEGRLMAMIESSEQLRLERLNLLTQVWARARLSPQPAQLDRHNASETLYRGSIGRARGARQPNPATRVPQAGCPTSTSQRWHLHCRGQTL